MKLLIYFGLPIDTPNAHHWAGYLSSRVRIEGNAVALFGRTGTVIGRADQPDAWVVELDESTPDDYYPRGGTVTVYGDALTVLDNRQ